MITQHEILKLYRKKFAHHTFNDIAKHTGIHKSRVFRIFNGHEMKVSEYEAFLHLIGKTAVESTIYKCQTTLPEHQLERLSSILERHLDAYLIAHPNKNITPVKHSLPEAL